MVKQMSCMSRHQLSHAQGHSNRSGAPGSRLDVCGLSITFKPLDLRHMRQRRLVSTRLHQSVTLTADQGALAVAAIKADTHIRISTKVATRSRSRSRLVACGHTRMTNMFIA